VLGDSKHRPLQLDVSVTSLVSGGTPDYRLTYVIRVAGDFDFELLKPRTVPATGRIGILWSAAASPEFFEALRKSERSTTAKNVHIVTVNGISAKSVLVLDDKFCPYAKSRPQVRFARTGTAVKSVLSS